MSNTNLDIRSAAAGAGIKLWEVAAAMGMYDSNFSRMLRKELSKEEKTRLFKVIRELKNNRDYKEPEEEKKVEDLATETIYKTDVETSNASIGNEMRKIRLAYGATMQEVAEVIGITTSGYQHIEYGTRMIKVEYLQKFSNYFNVSVDYLLGTEKNNSDFPDKKSLREAIAVLIECYTTLGRIDRCLNGDISACIMVDRIASAVANLAGIGDYTDEKSVSWLICQDARNTLDDDSVPADIRAEMLLTAGEKAAELKKAKAEEE